MRAGHVSCRSEPAGPPASLSSVVGREALMNRLGVFVLLVLLLEVCRANSIVFPAFDRPLVLGDRVIAHHTYGDHMVCIGKKDGTVLWRMKASTPIQRIYPTKSNHFLVVQNEKVSVIDSGSGHVVAAQNIPGSFFGCSGDDRLFYHRRNGMIRCRALDTGKEIWKFHCRERKSNIVPLLLDDFVFLSVSPRRIVGASISKGVNQLICLSSKDGAKIWKESLPLSKAGFGVHSQVSSGPKWLLCTTDNVLRLLSKDSGKVLHQWNSEDDIDGAAFLSQDRVVVCLGGVGAKTRVIRVLNIPNFKLRSQFRVRAERSSLRAVGDVLVLNSLYRSIGVNLVSERKIWEKGQRHYTVAEGMLYFGEHNNSQSDPLRVLGICDPKTGRDTVIYTEKVRPK